MYLRKVREANTCSCKFLIKQLHDKVFLCKEMLDAICRPRPKDAKNLVFGKYYFSDRLEEVR